MRGWLTWGVVYTLILASLVAVSPFLGWYAHLLWRAFDYGWSA